MPAGPVVSRSRSARYAERSSVVARRVVAAAVAVREAQQQSHLASRPSAAASSSAHGCSIHGVTCPIQIQRISDRGVVPHRTEQDRDLLDRPHGVLRHRGHRDRGPDPPGHRCRHRRDHVADRAALHRLHRRHGGRHDPRGHGDREVRLQEGPRHRREHRRRRRDPRLAVQRHRVARAPARAVGPRQRDVLRHRHGAAGVAGQRQEVGRRAVRDLRRASGSPSAR